MTAGPLEGATRLDFLGLPLHACAFDAAADAITALAARSERPPAVVAHVNAANFEAFARDPALRRRLADEALLLLDGVGMKAGARTLGLGWPPDLNGTDLFPPVAARARARGLALYFLGGGDDVAALAAERTRLRYPGVRIAGHRAGHFAVADEPAVVAAINASGADLLLVGRGCPRQEAFALRNRARLDVGAVWTVGGLFDFLSGRKPRAPAVVRALRLEWLFRLGLEPRRLGRRYLLDGPAFAARVVAERVRR